MKVSLNWIKDYVDLPRDMDLTRLAYDLTMSTVEVEGATDLARQFDHMLVGQITEVCPHPNADKLQICRTDIGGGDIPHPDIDRYCVDLLVFRIHDLHGSIHEQDRLLGRKGIFIRDTGPVSHQQIRLEYRAVG